MIAKDLIQLLSEDPDAEVIITSTCGLVNFVTEVQVKRNYEKFGVPRPISKVFHIKGVTAVEYFEGKK